MRGPWRATSTDGLALSHLASWSAAAAGTAALGASLAIHDEPAGLRILVVVPFVVAAAAAALRHSVGPAVAAFLLLGWSLVSAASVGLLYLPSAVLMAAAALFPASRRPRPCAGGAETTGSSA